MTVEYELTHDEYVDACAHHMASSPLVQGPVRKVQLLVFLLCATIGLLQLLAGWPVAAGLMGVFGVGLALGTPALTRRAQRRQLLRTAASGLVNGMFGRHRVTLLPEGIRDETEGYEWLIRWSAVEGVQEAGGVLMIYLGTNAFLPVPITAFSDRASALAFRDRFLELSAAARVRTPALEPAAPSDETRELRP